MNHLPAHPGGSAAESGSQLSKRESTHASPRGQRMRPRRRFRLVASRPLESQVSGPGYVILPATGAHTGLFGEPSPGFLGPHPQGVWVFQLIGRLRTAVRRAAYDAATACCDCQLETCHMFRKTHCSRIAGKDRACVDACSRDLPGGRISVESACLFMACRDERYGPDCFDAFACS